MEESKNILFRQNEPENLRYQTIASACYRHGKILSYFAFMCYVIIPCIFTIVQKFITNDTIVAVFCVITLLFWCVGIYLRKRIACYKNYGACFQQYFDENVLKIDTSSKKFIVQSTLLLEQRIKLMKKFKNKNIYSKTNWYNDYSFLSYAKAVFYCQTENIRWDLDLRKRYINFLFILGISLLIIIVLFAILMHQSVVTLILALFSSLAIIEYFYSSYNKISKDIKKQSLIKSGMEQVERNIKNDRELWNKIEEIQFEIFEYRKKAYLIPDWFYKIFRKNDQDVSDMLAKELKKERKELQDEQNDKKAD